MTNPRLFIFCSLLTRTLCVIAPQIPDIKIGDGKVINGPFWHEAFTTIYEDSDEDISTTTSEPLPFFEDDVASTNVTAQLGSRVHLHCRVHDLGEKTAIEGPGHLEGIRGAEANSAEALLRVVLKVRATHDGYRLRMHNNMHPEMILARCRDTIAIEGPGHLEGIRGAEANSAEALSRVILNVRATHDGNHLRMHNHMHPEMIFARCRETIISWVRRRNEELHLLSFGRHTYSADSRYSLAFEHPNDWRLLIQYVSERDEGYYECQMSTHPPLVRRVHLTVVVPKVEVVDERGRPLQDKFYKEGSIIELRCIVSEVPQPARQVNWKHGNRLLNYDTKRGGVSVKTEATSNGALSRLYIANANRNDSGNYTCSLADFAASAVSVHVLRGENPLAMQRGGASKISYPFLALFTCLLS